MKMTLGITIISFTTIFFTTILFTTVLFTAASIADTNNAVYKSIDKHGNVTYSSTPPRNAKNTSEVNIDAAPSDERIKAAQQRHESNLNAAELYDENRKAHDEFYEKEKRQQQSNKSEGEMLPNNYGQDFGYPYIPRRRPVTRPPASRPPASRPVQLPTMPRR